MGKWTGPGNAVLMGIALALLFYAPCGFAFDLGARGNVWITDISGHVRGNNGVKGSRLDLSDDLNMDVHVDAFGEAFFGVGRHRFTLGITYYDQEETRTPGEDVIFAGETFAAGSRLDSHLQWVMLEMEYAYTVVDLENVLAGFSLDAFVAARYQDGEMTLEGNGLSAKRTISWIRPLLGLNLHLGFLADLLELRFKAGGMMLSDEHLVDAVGEISLTPFPFLNLAVGYRYLNINVDANGLEQDYTLTGPYGGISIQF